jgi:2,4-dienoyl-CoA reductase-like NADH-dependent reductase (Old Yellow Enzyme family)
MTVGSIGLDCDLLASLGDGQTANCNLGSLDQLIERFERGDFDLIGVGRSMIAEPDWPQFVRKGELTKLKPFSISSLANALLPATIVEERTLRQSRATENGDPHHGTT